MTGIKNQHGVNLIELILSIVIVGIALGGVLLAFTQTVRFSADPMVQSQAIAVAEGYLDEILARPLNDPNGGETGSSEEGPANLQTSRIILDDVQDYDGLTEAPTDQNGNALDLGGGGYNVIVDVTPGLTVAGVPNLARVDVRVTFGTVVDFTLSGYKAPP